MKGQKIVLMLCVIGALCGFVYTVRQISENAVLSVNNDPAYVLIDPGHGGQDGGALSPSGAKESDINLAVSLSLHDMLSFCGLPVKMTRTADDFILHEDDVGNSSKVKDMYNRLEMYNKAAFTVSIHQNHFSQEKYHGAQLFYSVNRKESRDIAACIRTQILAMLQPTNTRELKAAGENIFLLHNTKSPAVIVECGFLSNFQEAEMLQNTQYQQQMAFAVCCGILQYTP